MSGDDFVILDVQKNTVVEQMVESDQKNPYELAQSSRMSIGSAEEKKDEASVGQKVNQINQLQQQSYGQQKH